MKVNEIMNRSVITCHPHENLSAIVNKMKLFNISGMPVAEKKRLVGMITLKDIYGYLPPPEEMCNEDAAVLKSKLSTPVGEIMKREVRTVMPATPVDEAAKIMVMNRINRLPVMDRGKIVGIVTRWDIIQALAEAEM